jgi:hypothetical protein
MAFVATEKQILKLQLPVSISMATDVTVGNATWAPRVVH